MSALSSRAQEPHVAWSLPCLPFHTFTRGRRPIEKSSTAIFKCSIMHVWGQSYATKCKPQIEIEVWVATRTPPQTSECSRVTRESHNLRVFNDNMPFGSVILDSDTHYGTEATTLGTKSPATR